MEYNLLFNLTFIFYTIATLGYVIFFVTSFNKIKNLGFFFSLSGFILQTMSLIIRIKELRHPPISNLYESLYFFAWAVILIYIFLEQRIKLRVIGVFVLPFVIILFIYASFLGEKIRPLVPALRSHWLGIHSGLCLFGYASFTLAFYFGIMYLLQERGLKSKRIGCFFFRLPSLALLDKLTYQTVILGLIFLAAGIITGSIWAASAWGSYWSWDPKETWSLITWLVYVFYLHARLVAGWRGRKSAYLAIIGFMSMLFTYLGVSFLLPGLHSYLQ
jgi:cytochrome c-type biogenesis protein CcsB